MSQKKLDVTTCNNSSNVQFFGTPCSFSGYVLSILFQIVLEDIHTYLQTLCNGKASVWKKRSLASKDRSDTYFKCVVIDFVLE